MITLGVPTLNRYADLVYLLDSAEHGTLIPDHYHIIDNGGKLDTRTLPAQDKLIVTRPERNLGVAASWNMLLRDTPEYLIISNDDVRVHEQTIERLITCAQDNPQSGFLHGHTATDGNAWSFFLHRAWLFNQLGPYDEAFWPAYFEDNDMGYRMLRAGILPQSVPGCTYTHAGSATLRAYTPSELEQHHQRFRANRDYYIRKWGGPPHAETYIEPFRPK